LLRYHFIVTAPRLNLRLCRNQNPAPRRLAATAGFGCGWRAWQPAERGCFGIAEVGSKIVEQTPRDWQLAVGDLNFFCAADKKNLQQPGRSVLIAHGEERLYHFAVLGRRQKQQTSLPKTQVISDVYGILARIVFTKSDWKIDLIRANRAGQDRRWYYDDASECPDRISLRCASMRWKIALNSPGIRGMSVQDKDLFPLG
jgi:hypothetical protein